MAHLGFKMARPKKEGLDYFPVDVDFDEKVQSIEMMHGNDGITWVIKFWQKAYKTMTGLVDFRGLFGELFSKNCRITHEKHKEILNTAVSVEFCYEYEVGVYTSDGIQKRISSVSSDRKSAIERQNSDKEDKSKRKVKKSKVKDCPDYSANNSGIIIWRENFDEYLKLAEPEFDKAVADYEWIAQMKRDYRSRRLCVIQSVEKMWRSFWGTEEGWKHCKKKKKGETMNWRRTIENGLSMPLNQVQFAFNETDWEADRCKREGFEV